MPDQLWLGLISLFLGFIVILLQAGNRRLTQIRDEMADALNRLSRLEEWKINHNRDDDRAHESIERLRADFDQLKFGNK